MKTALVTGGSGEIGKAICLRLAQDGHHIIVHAHNNIDNAQKIVKEIITLGGSAEAIFFDIGNHWQATTQIKKILEKYCVQILIHNAGIHNDVPMAGMKKEQWSKVLDVTLNGFFNVTQPLLLAMMKPRWGRIIAIGSVAGIMGNRGQVNYAAAKSGLHGACKSLSHEVASRGITVNVIAPGIIATNMTNDQFSKTMIEQLVPMKRAGNVNDIASFVSFLSSDEASYITGQVLSINGGMA
ncbi:MAG: 3-oxoacyl-ACP reductase FabG [Gammaproteobacteria bacterium]|nr:3-oxoacyl-ACP reductase FabG [Gammaproteobacteria bacterium]